MSAARMKTGYVYLVSVKGRFGRVLRLETSLRDPAAQIGRLARAGGRPRAPKLIGYEFVEDRVLACAQIRAGLKRTRVKGHPRSFRCTAALGRAMLTRAARRQAGLRKSRFHPQTGLLSASDIEIAGPITAFTSEIAMTLRDELGEGCAKLDLYLHPYLLGTITALFHAERRQSKIPCAYLPEILCDIAWRTFRCRLKPAVLIRLAHPSRREQGYLDLARYAFSHAKKSGAQNEQLVAFLRAPEEHLSTTMRNYAESLAHAPQVKLRNFLYRLMQLGLFTGLVLALDAVLDGTEPGRWLAGLLFLFVTGSAALAFNLYEKPDLTGGLGILGRREVERELKTLRPNNAALG
jgi:hypothetical protein